MKHKKVLKCVLWCATAISIVFVSSKTVYCTNFTSMDDYIKNHREQAASAGYESTSDLSDWGVTPSTNTENSSSSTAPSESNLLEPKKEVKACEHTYTDSIVKEPTCAEPGMMESKCSKCGDTYRTEIPATGKHEYTSEVTKEATCTEKGETTYTCTVCGDSYTEEIPMIEHTYESTIAEDATCTTAGTRVYICTGCDDSYTEEIPATGHVEAEEITKEPGLFSTGEKVVKCSTCGEILSTEVLPSKYSVTYLYIGLALLSVIAIGAVVLMIRSKKNGAKSERKIA
ncbi:hypothetical protein [Butyrivibrio sp. AC2005]|uniref:hypothetical protein n=1 Tax=Butyrivibrio sp. AC2005 TaxID=1280672 RepID=UPI0004029E2E|nr:hypothetical protein [Butyrivibrio sp. AC2005]